MSQRAKIITSVALVFGSLVAAIAFPHFALIAICGGGGAGVIISTFG